MKRILYLTAVFVVLCWVSEVHCDPPAKASGCKPLHGVTYDPFDASPDGICLSPEQVVVDVQIMATITKSIRLYSLAVCPETTMALMEEARNHGVSVLLGVFIGQFAENNEEELEMMETIMKEYSGVVQAIVVGTDAIINGKIGSTNRNAEVLSNVELLVEFIQRVKKILNKNGWKHQVSTSEGWGVWESEHGATLAEAIDFICLKITPYYEGLRVECSLTDQNNCISASDYANAKAEGLSKFYTKDVWVCETGWPTAGDACCFGIPDEEDQLQAIPSLDAATRYLLEFVQDADGRPYYISSAFDRDWRRIWSPCPNCAEKNLALSSFENGICDLCEQEYQLGIFDQNRQRKKEYMIPDVKCELPALPEIRVVEPGAEEAGVEEDTSSAPRKAGRRRRHRKRNHEKNGKGSNKSEGEEKSA